ncbi:MULTISPECIES: hypothetical protein [unclassified Pseudomonas]|uniref:hypothetical protein n=1 Tax=unclassified Pseudomonas TaxID=196821 RepID=UPI00128E8442|nr:MULTISPECIES: hypothetical protein [unclassified Pseudomonas]MPQ69202.1 hypothetical protein [Pseudomonas sp. MWU12-2323]
MTKKYRAVFVIPVGALKVLGEQGWEFFSEERLSSELEGFYVESFHLKNKESYLGLRAYEGAGVKLLVESDSELCTEFFYFRFYEGSFSDFLEVLKKAQAVEVNEVFIPDEF